MDSGEMVEVHELAQEGYEGYEQMVRDAIAAGIKEFPQQDFFVNVIWRKRRRARGGITKEATCWKAMPTPHFNQTVYLYHWQADDLEFMWSVPDQNICNAYYRLRHEVPPSDYAILEQVMSFMDGTLLKRVQDWEIKHGPISIK